MKALITLLLLLSLGTVRAADLFVEAESFSNKGGWVVDQQFMDLMGSPYLLAHGMGEPVDDAYTEVTFPEKGEYYVYVRTYNWTSPWKKGAGAVHIQTFRLKAVRSFFSKSFTLRLSCSCYCPQTSQQHASQNIAAEQ